MRLTPVRVPKRLTAAASAHRSAAQNGQYSPPMYSSCGFPALVSAGCPPTAFSPVAFPAPTASNVFTGMLVTCRWTCAVVSALAPPSWPAGDWLSFTAIRVTTSAITATTVPPASMSRLRAADLRSAARRAAIFCLGFPPFALVCVLAAVRASARALVRVLLIVPPAARLAIYCLRT
jgi:hypothetical protein